MSAQLDTTASRLTCIHCREIPRNPLSNYSKSICHKSLYQTQSHRRLPSTHRVTIKQSRYAKQNKRLAKRSSRTLLSSFLPFQIKIMHKANLVYLDSRCPSKCLSLSSKPEIALADPRLPVCKILLRSATTSNGKTARRLKSLWIRL
jgi:hypothetical protein